MSLGRGDAVIQFTKVDDAPSRWCLTGSRAVPSKEAVTSSPPATFRLSRRLAIPLALPARNGPSAGRNPV